MEINEIPNVKAAAIKLKRPKFVVDNPLKTGILDPMPSMHSFIVFAGPSRSGKTSLALSLLTNRSFYKRAFDKIYVFSPIHSLNSISDNPLLQLPDEQIYSDLNFETLTDVMNKIKENALVDMDSLIILDDYASQLKDKQISKLLYEAVCNRRHYRLSIWMLVQTYKSIPLSNRKTINVLITFKMKNRSEAKSIAEEMSDLNIHQFQELQKYIFDNTYNFMMLNRDTDCIYKNFNEIKCDL